tara:strand:- start:2528 stop:4075 length:1548 start_codon:yes stop_codon:yes gene_type:complete
MSMNSDIVKGVVGTSAGGYKTFGDIKLYGGNVYKASNAAFVGNPSAVVGEFCYLRVVSGQLRATKPIYVTSAAVSPVSDSSVDIYCNGFVLEEDPNTGEVYVAVSGVLEAETLPGTTEATASDMNILRGMEFYLDWSTSGGGERGTLALYGTSGVLNTFLSGQAAATADDYPLLRASLRPIVTATADGMAKLDFGAPDSVNLFSQSLTLYSESGTNGFLSFRSGDTPVEVFSVNNSGDVDATGLITCSPPAGDGSPNSVTGGIRTNHIGGTGLGINSLFLSTGDAVTGHFNPVTSDTGTFTLYGPGDTGGALSITADSVNLNAVTDLKLVGATPGDLNQGLGASSTFLLAVDPNTGKVYRDNTNTATRSLFTGTHAYRSQEDLPIGSSVTLTGGSLALTTSTSQTNCAGIIQQGMQASEDAPITTSTGEVVTSGNVYYVAAVGDSIKGDLLGFKVCNEGGDISEGDLLVTSSTPGRLMKQADDIIRSSTVGKAMQDVTFNDSGEADDIYGFIYCG